MLISPLKKYADELLKLEVIIIQTLRNNYSKGAKKSSSRSDVLTSMEMQYFSEGWGILRDAFVNNPGAKDQNYLQNVQTRSTYILHYLMPNVQRWLHLYENCRLPFLKENLQDPIVLDIGAGPATSALAFLIFYHKQIQGTATFELTDFNLSILKDGKVLLEEFAKILGVSVRVFITGGLNRTLPERAQNVDFVLMGNVWNESISSHEAARNRALTQWSEAIAKVSKKETKFFFMEPANRRSSRLLMGIRDFFAEDDIFQILAPCPHGTETKPCTLNRIPGRPWCHFNFNAHMTPLMSSANEYVEISHERLGYSYLTLGFQKNEKVLTARVIGDIMRIKDDKVGCYVCHEKGRAVLEAEDRKTLPLAGQALVKPLVILKEDGELKARIKEDAPNETKKEYKKKYLPNKKPHTSTPHEYNKKQAPIKKQQSSETPPKANISPKRKQKIKYINPSRTDQS